MVEESRFLARPDLKRYPILKAPIVRRSECRLVRDFQRRAGKLVNLPEGAFSPFPPTDFVEQETADLNRRRVTLLESQPAGRSGLRP